MDCSLCTKSEMRLFFREHKREYWRCAECALVAVPVQFWLSESAEKQEYDLHQNNADDLGYQAFLNRTWQPLSEQLAANARGLDFGCGPGPTLSVLAQQAGFKVANYDKYYFNHPELLARQYDFITLTEVIEHIADAAELLNLLESLLNPGGILAIMTKRVTDQQAFSRWHYKNDPTHIRFYHLKTFEWIAQRMNWQLQVIAKDVVFFRRQ